MAWDRERGCILPFQVLSTRKRKSVEEDDIKVRVAIFAFDCLYLNGEVRYICLCICKKKRSHYYSNTVSKVAFAKTFRRTTAKIT